MSSDTIKNIVRRKWPEPPIREPIGSEYREQAARLLSLFPRGRIVADADGTAIIVAKARRIVRDHLFEQAPGRLVGLLYVGRPKFYLDNLAGLVERHLVGDGEGILHLRWCPELAKALPWFSRRGGHRRGRLFAPDQGGTSATVVARGGRLPPQTMDAP